MEGFTIVDAAVAVIVIFSAILSYSRGLVREVFAILGWVAAGVAAFMFAGQAAPLIKQVPVLDSFLADNCEGAIIAGFFVVFAGALIVMSILTPLFASVIQRSALSGIDQGLGFLFGVARGALLIAVAFLLYSRLLASEAVPMVDNSRSMLVFSSLADKLNEEVPTDAPGWLVARYNELVGPCGGATTVVAPAASGAAAGTATGETTDTTGTTTSE